MFRVGDWTVRRFDGIIEREGESRAVRPKPMELLVLLAEHAGTTVTKDTILETLWRGTTIEESGLPRCVSELRSALGDDARKPTYIHTQPRRGYRLLAPVSPSAPAVPVARPEEASSTENDAPSIPQVSRGAGARHRRGLRRLGIAAAIALGFTGLIVLREPSSSPTVEARLSGETALGALGGGGTRAVVVGFEAADRGDVEDRDTESWIGEAITYMLTAELAATTALRLVPVEGPAGGPAWDGRLAAEQRSDPARLHAMLAAEVAITGQYVLSGDQRREIRIDLVVSHVPSGEVMAGHVEEGSLDQLSDLVTLGAQRLRQRLDWAGPETGRQPIPETARKLPDAYFRARVHLERFESRRAAELLVQSVAEAPDAPWPRLALAEAWSRLGEDRSAAEAVDAALARAADLRGEERLWLDARAAALTARWDDAIARLEALTLLEPEHLDYRLALAWTLLDARRFAEAAVVIEDLRDRVPDTLVEPRLLIAEGRVALASADRTRAFAAAQAAVTKSRELRMPIAEGRALLLEAEVLDLEGQPSQAMATLDQAETRLRLAGDRPGEAEIAVTRGIWLEHRGDMAGAEAEIRRALAISRRLGDRSGETYALRRLGPHLWRRGDAASGRAALDEALAISRDTGDLQAEATLLHTLGICHAQFGGGEVEPYFERALALYERTGDRANQVRILNDLARVAMIAGQSERALSRYRASAALVEDVDVRSRAVIGFNLGHLEQNRGRLDEARRQFLEALRLYDQRQDPFMVAACLEGLGTTARLAGDLPSATAYLVASLRLRQTLEEPYRLIRGETTLARLMLDLGRLDDAEALVRSARSRPEAEGLELSQRANLIEVEARLHLARGRARDALETVAPLRPFGDQGSDWQNLGFVARQITVARVLAASGDRDAADSLLGRLIEHFEARGAIVSLVEAHLAAIAIASAAHDQPDRGRVEAVRGLAREHGLGLALRALPRRVPLG